MSKIEYTNKRLLLVDNGSTDRTVEAVADRFPDVEVIVNSQNLGFSAGTNVGLKFALSKGADYIFLLNNDTLVEPGALSRLLQNSASDVGMVAPKIFYSGEPNRIWSIGGRRHWLTTEKSGDARGQLDRGQVSNVLERDYLAGCALLISRPFLEENGLFDEQFFMYYEDSDLSLRAREAGYRLLLAPDAHVWHKVASSSGGTDSPNERYWMARSSVRFYRKHVHGLRWLIVAPYRFASAIKTLLRLLAKGRSDSARAYLRGMKDGFMDSIHGEE